MFHMLLVQSTEVERRYVFESVFEEECQVMNHVKVVVLSVHSKNGKRVVGNAAADKRL